MCARRSALTAKAVDWAHGVSEGARASHLALSESEGARASHLAQDTRHHWPHGVSESEGARAFPVWGKGLSEIVRYLETTKSNFKH